MKHPRLVAEVLGFLIIIGLAIFSVGMSNWDRWQQALLIVGIGFGVAIFSLWVTKRRRTD